MLSPKSKNFIDPTVGKFIFLCNLKMMHQKKHFVENPEDLNINICNR